MKNTNFASSKLFLFWITELSRQNSEVLFSAFFLFFRSTHRWWKSEEKQTTRNGANRVFIGWWIETPSIANHLRRISVLGFLGFIKWLIKTCRLFIVSSWQLYEKPNFMQSHKTYIMLYLIQYKRLVEIVKGRRK